MMAAAMMMRMVTMGWRWAIRSWTADATAAGFTLSHPAAKWIATAVIAIDLVDR